MNPFRPSKYSRFNTVVHNGEIGEVKKLRISLPSGEFEYLVAFDGREEWIKEVELVDTREQK